MRILVPGSILVAGEYAVLEDGAVGIAMAVDRFVSVDIHDNGIPLANRLVFTATTGRDTWRAEFSSIPSEWEVSGNYGNHPIGRLITTVLKHFRSACANTPVTLTGRITINSAAHFLNSGQKIGLGSSAAVVVGILRGLVHLLRMRRTPHLPHLDLLGLALSAHRDFQNGLGSGYDIYTAYYGGIGMFTGGRSPIWETVNLPWIHSVALLNGSRPAATVGAINRYDRWRSIHREAWERFLTLSSAVCKSILSSRTYAVARRHFTHSRLLNEWVNRAIGIHDDSDLTRALDMLYPYMAKSVGGGYELGIAIFDDNPWIDLLPLPLVFVNIAKEVDFG